MKKLAVVMMITALSIFMFSAAASAEEKNWKNFHGTYEMTAKANCLTSTTGWTLGADGAYYPNEGATVTAAADTAYGTWTFNRDGTGTVQGWNYAFDLPPGPSPKARFNPINFDFEYDLTRDGVITVRVTAPPPVTSLVMTGRLSQDHKMMTLNNVHTRLNFYTIHMASRTLIRVSE